MLAVDDFPTDRYLVEGIAADLGCRVVWLDAGTTAGVTGELLAPVLGDRTALVVLSHVTYRSGFMADGPGLTRQIQQAGALVLWDFSHSVGSVEVDLDAVTRLNVALRLVHVSVLDGGSNGTRLGCEWLRIGAEGSRVLQRYIDLTQRRQRLILASARGL